MKTLRLLVIIFFLTCGFTTVYSQSQPLAVENASWLIHSRWMIPFGEGHQFWAYSIQGDTSINGNTYKKVYVYNCGIFPNGLPNPMPTLQASSKTLAGFLRDADQKVYAIMKNPYSINCPVNTEYLLFDFTYQIGDTIKSCNSGYPQSTLNIIDNIIQNDPPYYCKTFYFGGRMLYEGIGSSEGLFEDFDFIDLWVNLENYSTDGLTGLGVITGIKDLKSKAIQFDLYPNPAQNFITIKVTGFNDFSDLSINIFNMQGQLVLQQNLCQSKTEIDISRLQQGVYLAKIKLNDKVMIQNNFVVMK
jgi:hypothetical protein